MTNAVLERRSEPWFRRLYLPTYRLTDAARYAKTRPATVASWHYGEEPVLTERQLKKPLNYLQLVEVAFVAFFRRMGISMYRIRQARQYVAQNFNAEYPFAEYLFKTEGFHVLMELERFEPAHDFERLIVADQQGQLAWESLLGDKFAEFDYEYELALRWYPAGRRSLVVIDPRFAFGAPMVKGIPTWVIRGRWAAKESPEEISSEFGLTREEVRDALVFEGIDADS